MLPCAPSGAADSAPTAIAPCIIGPEASRADLDAMAIVAESAAPLGAHSNIAKLVALAYGQAISQMEIPGEQL